VGLTRRQVEKRLLALVQLDSGRQALSDGLDQAVLTHGNPQGA
jgi:hypothetical protein